MKNNITTQPRYLYAFLLLVAFLGLMHVYGGITITNNGNQLAQSGANLGSGGLCNSVGKIPPNKRNDPKFKACEKPQYIQQNKAPGAEQGTVNPTCTTNKSIGKVIGKGQTCDCEEVSTKDCQTIILKRDGKTYECRGSKPCDEKQQSSQGSANNNATSTQQKDKDGGGGGGSQSPQKKQKKKKENQPKPKEKCKGANKDDQDCKKEKQLEGSGIGVSDKERGYGDIFGGENGGQGDNAGNDGESPTQKEPTNGTADIQNTALEPDSDDENLPNGATEVVADMSSGVQDENLSDESYALEEGESPLAYFVRRFKEVFGLSSAEEAENNHNTSNIRAKSSNNAARHTFDAIGRFLGWGL